MSATALTTPEVHHQHRDVTGGWLRPSVFGAMDGLVSNFALIAGVAAAGVATHTVVLTGLAGLVAGSFSMATGEYTSVSSQRELVQREIAVERRELVHRPDAEQAELAELYRRRGLSAELAEQVAQQLSRDPDVAWRVHAREELGVDPDALPSPLLAAGSSLGSFAVGALVPLLPYVAGARSLLVALAVSALALLLLGAVVARFTGRPAWQGALRQLALGAVAAAVTTAIGHGLRVGVG